MTDEPRRPGPVGEGRLWNESMLGWWYDEAAGIAGFSRLAHLPNNGEAQLYQAILTHDGRRFRRNGRIGTDDAERSERWRSEGLSARFDDEGWQVAYDGGVCTARLCFTDLHPAVDTARLATTVGDRTDYEHDMFYAGHLEAGCRVRGKVTLDGEVFEIDALGFRDHSWGGIRDMTAVRSTRWVVGTCGPELSYGLSFASVPSGPVVRTGWVHRDGRLHATTEFDVLISLDMDGNSWRRGEAWAVLDDGSRIEWRTDDVWDGVLVSSDNWTSFETATTGTVDGRRGVVNIEMSNNPRGGFEDVSAAVRACATDGLSRRVPG